MTEDKFEEWIKETIESLPRIFRKKLENVQIVIEDRPPVGFQRKYPLPGSSLMLGLYQGVPLIKRGVHFSNIFPDKIIIFRSPIERICSSEKQMKKMVNTTLLHEIGHYFGLDEKQLRQIKAKQS